MAYNALNNLIDAYIYANGVQAITGQILNGVLKQMVSQLGSGYHLMGVAGPETVPASNDYAMAYFAATAGEYTDFGGITLAAGEVAVLLTSGNGSWSKETIYNVPTGTADLENTANFITNAVTDLVNYYTKTEVDDTLANYPTLEALATALADYYTKQEIDTILAGYTTNTALASALADYYNKNDIDGLLSVVNAALADRYTKSETDTKLADYYRKAETYDKDEVDSIVAALSRQEYIIAWDGLAAPDVSAIPAGVTVTYSGTTYTGTLAASASTVNKIYMVWNGTAYDMYGTSQDGGYSWVPMGTTTVDLSQYATKAELSQLEAEVNNYYSGAYIDRYGNFVASSGWGVSDYVPYSSGSVNYKWNDSYENASGACIIFYDANKAVIDYYSCFGASAENDGRLINSAYPGTKYIRTSFQLGTSSHIQIAGVTVWSPQGIKERVEVLENLDIENNLTEIEAIVGEFPGITDKGGTGIVPYHFAANKLLLNDVLTTLSGYNTKYTDLIPCSEGDVFVYYTGPGNINAALMQCRFFDSGKNSVGGLRFRAQNNTRYARSVVTIPSGVSYVRFSSNNFTSNGEIPKFYVLKLNGNLWGGVCEYLLENINSLIEGMNGDYLRSGDFRQTNTFSGGCAKFIQPIPCSPGDKFIYKGKSVDSVMGWYILHDETILTTGQYDGETIIEIASSYTVGNDTYTPNAIVFQSIKTGNDWNDVTLEVYKVSSVRGELHNVEKSISTISGDISALDSALNTLAAEVHNDPIRYDFESVANAGVLYEDGSINASSGVRVTDFIPVSEGDVVFFKNLTNSSYYAALAAFSSNEESSYIKLKSIAGTGNTFDCTYTVPNGVSYIRFSQHADYLEGIYYTILSKTQTEKDIEELQKNETTSKDSVNLFDINNTLDGYYYNASSYSAGEGYALTNPIKVSIGTTYKLPHASSMGGIRRAAKCDANGNYISGIDLTSDGDFDVVTVGFDGYIRFNVGLKVSAETFMVCKQSEYPNYFIPFGRTLANTWVDESAIIQGYKNPLYGKILASDGDSICYGVAYRDGYIGIIANRNRMKFQNLGIAGATLASNTYSGETPRHWISTNVANLRSDADYIIIEGGVNDSEAMGTMSPTDFTGPFDSTTFRGAIDTLCQSLYARFPGKKIGFIIVHAVKPTWMPGGERYEAVVAGFKKWGIPVCDLVEQCPPFGLLASDDYLKVTYTKDGDGWHPNEDGYKKFYCDKIEAWMKTL